jgi:hypothetical protein
MMCLTTLTISDASTIHMVTNQEMLFFAKWLFRCEASPALKISPPVMVAKNS